MSNNIQQACPILKEQGIYESDAKGGIDTCLNCPLWDEDTLIGECVLVGVVSRKPYTTRIRDREIKNSFYTGKTISELATMYEINERTAQRIITDRRIIIKKVLV